MSSRSSGVGFILRNYPAIMREGIQIVTDDPYVPELRVDHDGPAKRELRRSRMRHPVGAPEPAQPVQVPEARETVLSLQWLDRSYTPTWRDTEIAIDAEARKIISIDAWMLGRRRHGSGAIGVFIFAAPALLALSPYLAAKSALWRSRERKAGMSRHAIALLGRLHGQLDPVTEELLREALKNEWAHDRKMTRRVTFVEARDALTECEMVVQRFGKPESHPRGEARYWTDADGDLIARCELSDGDPNPPRIVVLGSTFEGDEARVLMDVCLHRKDEDDSDTA